MKSLEIDEQKVNLNLNLQHQQEEPLLDRMNQKLNSELTTSEKYLAQRFEFLDKNIKNYQQYIPRLFNTYIVPKSSSNQFLNFFLILFDMEIIQFRPVLLMYTAVLQYPYQISTSFSTEQYHFVTNFKKSQFQMVDNNNFSAQPQVIFSNYSCHRGGDIRLTVACSGTRYLISTVFNILAYSYCIILSVMLVTMFVYIFYNQKCKYATLDYHMNIRELKKLEKYQIGLRISQIYAILIFIFFIILEKNQPPFTFSYLQNKIYPLIQITYTFIEGAQTLKSHNSTMIGKDCNNPDFKKIYLRFNNFEMFYKKSEFYFEEIYDRVIIHLFLKKQLTNKRWKDFLIDHNQHKLIIESFEKYIYSHKNCFSLLSN